MAPGMGPETVAARALDGVAADRFLIATHHHVRRYADERAADLATALENSAPQTDLPWICPSS